MVKVVVGGFYKSADGEKVGPMIEECEDFTVNDGSGRVWTKYGQRWSRAQSHNDLIAEWVDEPAAPVSPAPEAEDGKWIAWNGGECPEHPATVVEVVFTNIHGDTIKDIRCAGVHRWEDSTHAYRVIRRFVEPKAAREFWLVGGSICLNREAAERRNICGYDELLEIIHVREVIEPEIDQAVK